MTTDNRMRKVALPSVNAGTITNSAEAVRFLEAVKQNLDIITGRTQNQRELESLPPNATMADVIAMINRISGRLNTSGEAAEVGSGEAARAKANARKW